MRATARRPGSSCRISSRAWAEPRSTRITVIAAGQPGVTVGTVVADSDVSDRARWRITSTARTSARRSTTALHGRTGLAIRPSPTLGVDMMYLALPLREGGRTVDVIRVAVPLTAVNEALDSLYARIIGSALLVALIAAGIGLYVSSRISGQMRAIKAGAERIAAGDFSHEGERAADRGVRGGRREPQPDGLGAGRQAAHADRRSATSARRCCRAWSRACWPSTSRSA